MHSTSRRHSTAIKACTPSAADSAYEVPLFFAAECELNMKRKISSVIMHALVLTLPTATSLLAQPAGARRPEGPCDIYTAADCPCVAAHSTTRALYAAYNGPLYQVMRQSDGKTMD